MMSDRATDILAVVPFCLYITALVRRTRPIFIQFQIIVNGICEKIAGKKET